MITLKFSTEDIPEQSKKFYKDFELKYNQMHDATIEDMIEIFETFLKAKGFDDIKLNVI